MRIAPFFAALSLTITLGACTMGPPPKTVDSVDLGKYSGVWYEIARIPQPYEAGCTNASAAYSPLPDGRLSVINRCNQNAPDGPLKEVKGVARSVNPPANSKLKVKFGLIEGDYWIFRLTPDYTTAVVGSPDRQSLWILNRIPAMDPDAYQQLIASLKADGLPADKLVKTPR